MKRLVKGVIRRIRHSVQGAVLLVKYPQLRNAFAVHSHLTRAERIKLYELTANALAVAEIGSYVGASACCFGAALKERGSGKVFCIDTWKNDAMSEGNRDTWGEFQKNTAAYREFMRPVRGFSTAVVEIISEQTGSLDVLFIDGDHSYDAVRADWMAYKSLLKSGSIVIFHDYGWADGVMRVVGEDVMPYVDDHHSLPNMWWGTISTVP